MLIKEKLKQINFEYYYCLFIIVIIGNNLNFYHLKF